MATPKLGMLVRSFSTSNASNQLVKAPIQIFGIDGRYASALYSAASKSKNLETVEKELTNLQATLKQDAKLKEFIVNPTYKRTLKSNALKAVGAKISLSPQSSNLLQVLAENGRLKNLEGIINSYKLLMSAHRGEVTCEVTTAKPLDAAQKQKLESALRKFLKKNESLHLTTKVDPNILGGMVVSIADKYVDMSVATKIRKYTQLIQTVV